MVFGAKPGSNFSCHRLEGFHFFVVSSQWRLSEMLATNLINSKRNDRLFLVP